ncbi:hypothetical protein D3C84_1191450 [compost metagenome]
MEPATQAISAMASDWPNLKGVMKVKSPPSTTATARPMPQVAQLKLRLTWGAKGFR